MVNYLLEGFDLLKDVLSVGLYGSFLSLMVVGSDSASLFDDLLNNLYGRLEVLVQLELGVLNEGTLGVLGDDAADGGPEYSLEYFIR